ncbi:VOC family protein [Paraburkholderia strydomiana]|uniref:VOC family protein n=1 Tax=Paraburkholderia strydomiana TaxID=1245417 RepID=UPI002856CA68|nr:VOC family protein [Paraburkholderia strydomiana]MDR7008887.1 catechol 2,3-dioxygenase-like lactoylglutathione lyase family enzyme [Paraburkholderia strydomiana]
MTSSTSEIRDPPFRIGSVDHTGITVSSIASSLDFWVRGLGFRHLYTWEFENSTFVENLVGVKGASLTLAMVQGFGHQIELLEYRSPADRAIFRPRSCDVGSVHLAMYVDNLDALIECIRDAGWLPVGAPQRIEGGERDGWKLAYVRDPDGVTLEFLQPASAAEHAEA